MATIEEASGSTVPTQENPEVGYIGWFDVVLSEVEHWIEDGDYVFRSREFDVTTGAPNLNEAISRFTSATSEYAAYLAELEDPGENEVEMFRRLAPRLIQVAEHLERREKEQADRIINISFGRRRGRGDYSRTWHPRSRPLSNFSQPSPA